MNIVASELSQAERDLKRQGQDIAWLRQLGNAIPRVSEESLEQALAEFHNAAGRFPYWQDYDIGALILEDVADTISPGRRRSILYQHALYRAQWCASAASAGGEGIARSQHLVRLREKLPTTRRAE